MFYQPQHFLLIYKRVTTHHNKIQPGSIWQYPKFFQTALSNSYNIYIRPENPKRYPFLDLVLPYENSPNNNFLHLHNCIV